MGSLVLDIQTTDKEASTTWLRILWLKAETESLIIAAQVQALCSN